MNSIGNALNSGLRSLGEAAQGAARAVGNTIGSLGERTVTAAKIASGALLQAGTAVFEGIKAIGRAIGDRVAQAFSGEARAARQLQSAERHLSHVSQNAVDALARQPNANILAKLAMHLDAAAGKVTERGGNGVASMQQMLGQALADLPLGDSIKAANALNAVNDAQIRQGIQAEVDRAVIIQEQLVEAGLMDPEPFDAEAVVNDRMAALTMLREAVTQHAEQQGVAHLSHFAENNTFGADFNAVRGSDIPGATFAAALERIDRGGAEMMNSLNGYLPNILNGSKDSSKPSPLDARVCQAFMTDVPRLNITLDGMPLSKDKAEAAEMLHQWTGGDAGLTMQLSRMLNSEILHGVIAASREVNSAGLPLGRTYEGSQSSIALARNEDGSVRLEANARQEYSRWISLTPESQEDLPLDPSASFRALSLSLSATPQQLASGTADIVGQPLFHERLVPTWDGV
ncbi:hypothetical protein [Telmatospirillum sp. J64-1]|uniref:hypothetical protein n=1 Tax=Telmatospirillum sp. J64-1 TaxID=2502183 RepID=UPI00115EB08F|nr:hypothetical protein [Telmatospirillum sp. J64-1]